MDGASRQRFVVRAEPMAMRVGIGEDASLQNLVDENPMPGTTLEGEKAACSISAK